nr:hypothetical protein [Tanacetum cinerariifolium]
MEFCVLVNDASFPKEILGTEASRKLKEVSLLSPDVQRSEISSMVHDEYAICYRGHSAKVLESFKVEVGINMTEVIGRVMEPPYLEMGDNSILTLKWFLWASGKNKLNVEAFIQKLRDCGTGMEVQMENPLVVRETCMKIGVLTQCCLSENASKASSQFLANLCLKINVKLGGINVKLHNPFPHFSDDDSFMFIGADVSHPDELKRLSYSSVAALVGSVDPPSATRYTLLVDGGHERSHIDTKSYRLLLTFVVAQKRHNIRLVLDDERERVGKCASRHSCGHRVHLFQFDFYLCSHFGATGTSKPTHCSVIWDENGFSSDEMQKLIYHLSYLFARCSKPVSLVPPVYYTHLAAYRGQMLQEVAWQAQSSSMSVKVADCLKDSMFFV